MKAPAVKCWWFAPIYAWNRNSGTDSTGPPDIVETTLGLDYAFKRAREKWPTAVAWRCLGRVNPRDSERYTLLDAGWEERVIRSRLPRGQR